MSEEGFDVTRERNPQTDFIKLQLLMVVNQLRTEILMLRAQHGNIIDKILSADSPKELNKAVHFDVANIRDRIDLLLSIAKNLLRSQDDPDNNEYQTFANLVSVTLNFKLMKVKKFGLQRKLL